MSTSKYLLSIHKMAYLTIFSFIPQNCSLNFISNSHLNLHRQKVHLKMLIPQLEMGNLFSDDLALRSVTTN